MVALSEDVEGTLRFYRVTNLKDPDRRAAERWDLVGLADTDILEGWGNRCTNCE